ncbi:hypothetical protein QL287_01125 [Mycoplasma sp. M6620]|nr:hypothetical protein [Mycoplasma phocimorsus]
MKMGGKNIFKYIKLLLIPFVSFGPFLLSIYYKSNSTFNIKYQNTNNIETNQLIKKYNNKIDVPLTFPKAKNGLIFVNWVDIKNNFPLNFIPAGEQRDIILQPYLIKEYNNFSSKKMLFLQLIEQNILNQEFEYVALIKEILNKEEYATGYNKYNLQREFILMIDEFNDDIFYKKTLIKNVMPLQEQKNKLKLQSNQGFVVHEVEGKSPFIDSSINTHKINNSSFLNKFFNFFSNNSTTILSAIYSTLSLATVSGIGYSVYKGIKDKKDWEDSAKQLEEDLKAKSTYTFQFETYKLNNDDFKWKVFKYSSDDINTDQNNREEITQELIDVININNNLFTFEFKYNPKYNKNNRLIIYYERQNKNDNNDFTLQQADYSYDIYLWNFYDKKNNMEIDVYDRHKKNKIGKLKLNKKEKHEIQIKSPSR